MNKEKHNRTVSNPYGALNKFLSRFTIESPFSILVILIVTIFIFEWAIMYVFNQLSSLSPMRGGILDATILSILVFPILYIFVFRPLIRQMKRHKETEQAFQISNESFNNIVRKGIDGIIVTNQAKKILFMNQMAEILLNCKAEDCIDQPFGYPLELGRVSNINITHQNGEDGTGELQIGETEWHGQPAYLVILRDITEQINTQRALQKSENKFRSLALSATDAVIGLDDSACISIWNEAAHQMFGYSEKEALGIDLHSLIVPERYRGKAYEGLKSFSKTGNGSVIGQTLEITGLRKDGSEFPIELSVSAWVSDGSWYATGVIRDITNRKLNEDALKQSEEKYRLLSKQLSESNDMKELLLDIITHDLKNPAGVIDGFAGLLLEQDSTDEMTQSIKKSSDTLLKVIDNATALAGVAMGESIEKQEINLSQMLQNVKSEFEQIAKQAGMEIKFHSPGDIYINANPILSEVFKNYVSNAIKYAKDGKQIILEIKEEDESIRVYVQDFGKTISEGNRDAIFLRQARLESNQKGRGLGLAIVKRIADAHGGKVWVEPNEPTGNRFCFEIPK